MGISDEEKSNFSEEKKNLVSVELSSENVLDMLLEEVNWNKTYFFLGLFNCLLFFIEGFTLISMDLRITIIEKHYNLSPFQTGLLESSISIGYLISSFISGFLVEYGQCFALRTGVFLIAFVNILQIFSSGYWLFFLINLMLGLGLGIIIICIITITAEFTNSKIRSFFISYVRLFVIFGQIMSCVLAEFFDINHFKKTNWSHLVEIRAVLCIILIGFSFLLYDGPKFLFSKRKFENGIKHLKYFLGDQEFLLTEDKKFKIINQYNDFIKSNEISSSSKWDSYVKIFSSNYFKLTLYLLPSWFLISFTYNGLVYFLPTFFDYYETYLKGLIRMPKIKGVKHDDFKLMVSKIIISCFFEIPAILVQPILNNIIFIGRTGTMKISLVGIALLSLFGYILQNEHFAALIGILRGLGRMLYNSIYVYTTEAYPSNLKATALGIHTVSNKLGLLIMPFINRALAVSSPFNPLLGFFLNSIITFFLIMMFPYDTLNRAVF
jgi:hypothetical protein